MSYQGMVISNRLTFLAPGQSFHKSDRAVKAAIEINNKHIFPLVAINKDPLKIALAETLFKKKYIDTDLCVESR